MKKITLLTTLVFSLTIFSSPSYADWTLVSENAEGTTFYVDFERIRKHDGYVYWWTLQDLLKPDDQFLSVKTYRLGDCKLFRYRSLSFSFHKEPMGGGTGDVQEPHKKGWKYPSPDSVIEYVLKVVCAYAN